ncbi:hypothetical protein [Mesorhizobium sp.]|uniref:hypothetical protein n=1 Tax=Mesorhizobium sp. TaxID=1871066 RepID=UPI0025C61E1B|nr:hypothetical protein [Mesorhizobium sp.]
MLAHMRMQRRPEIGRHVHGAEREVNMAGEPLLPSSAIWSAAKPIKADTGAPLARRQSPQWQ